MAADSAPPRSAIALQNQPLAGAKVAASAEIRGAKKIMADVYENVAKSHGGLAAPKWDPPQPLSPFKTAHWRALNWRRRLTAAAVGGRGRFGALPKR